MYNDIIESDDKTRRRLARRSQVLAWVAILLWAVFCASVIILASQKLQDDFNVPDLAVCSLKVVECGQWEPMTHDTGLTGIASWYDYELASGWSSLGHRVAAVRHVPRGTMLRVTNLENGKSVEVKVTDYGPDASIHPDRVVDLSSHAFGLIADTKMGIIKVKIERI